MNILSKTLAGSRMYGLESKDSDYDYRGVFYHSEISKIIGLERHDHQDTKTETEDSFYWEIRQYLNSLRKSNTMSLELLYNDNWLECSSIFKEIQKNREQLIDSEHLYNSLTGYLHNEWRLCCGERKGDIGSKRRDQLDKYGFSPKNYVNLLRLCYSGAHFYNTGEFPSNFCKYLPFVGNRLKEIRNNPGLVSTNGIDGLKSDYFNAKQYLDECYAKTDVQFKFNKDYANDILVEVYGPQVLNRWEEVYNIKHSL